MKAKAKRHAGNQTRTLNYFISFQPSSSITRSLSRSITQISSGAIPHCSWPQHFVSLFQIPLQRKGNHLASPFTHTCRPRSSTKSPLSTRPRIPRARDSRWLPISLPHIRIFSTSSFTSESHTTTRTGQKYLKKVGLYFVTPHMYPHVVTHSLTYVMISMELEKVEPLPHTSTSHSTNPPPRQHRKPSLTQLSTLRAPRRLTSIHHTRPPPSQVG